MFSQTCHEQTEVQEETSHWPMTAAASRVWQERFVESGHQSQKLYVQFFEGSWGEYVLWWILK